MKGFLKLQEGIKKMTKDEDKIFYEEGQISK